MPPARWLSIPGGNDKGPGGDYVYMLQFVVPSCIIPSSVTVSGTFAGDDTSEIYLDGNTTPIATSCGFQTPCATPFSSPVAATPGVHVLRVVVHNSYGPPTGMVLNGSITVTCPGDRTTVPPNPQNRQ